MSEPFVITKELVRKINQILDKGLVNGLGVATPGKFCVEAAICYALGERHDDKPSCVNPYIADFKIELNDCQWSSNKARAEGLRKLAIAQLGSKKFSRKEFLEKTEEKCKRELAPWLLSKIILKRAFRPTSPKEIRLLRRCYQTGTSTEAHRRAFIEITDCYPENWNSLLYVNKRFKFKKDEQYKKAAEILLSVLKEMKSPGVKYL